MFIFTSKQCTCKENNLNIIFWNNGQKNQRYHTMTTKFNLSDKLKKRLKSYSLSAGAIVTTAAGADAQIIYTDIVPDDTVTGGGSSYALDLNNDGTVDFNFQIVNTGYTYVSTYGTYGYQISGIGVVAANSNNGALTDSNSYPYALSSGAAINNLGNFGSSAALIVNNVSFSTYGTYTYAYSYAYGNWAGATDKYLGLKLQVGSNSYYGWARLTVLSDTQFIIKDYAYESIAGNPINAGDTFSVAPVTTDSVINVVGADVANNGNGLDLEVAFNMIADETTISAYRILVVKEPDTISFNLAAAQAVAAANYLNVTPTGSNITTVLAAGSRDVDGDLITDNVPYRVYIMTVADGVNAQLNNLSEKSNHVTLMGATFPSDPATSLAATDIADNGNGSDIQVFFAKAANENKVDEYRVMAVKTASAATFSLADAQAAPMASYFTVNPAGTPFYTTALSASLEDVDGDVITTGVPYRLFVLSIADGNLANQDVLSNQSNQVTLNALQSPDSVQNVMLADVAENGNGLDLNVSFDKIADENTIDEYRIFIVKSASAASFSLFDAIGNPNHEVISKTGANISTELFATSVDADGDIIQENVPYKAVIMSVADGNTTQIDKLSAPSNEATLLDATYIDELSFSDSYNVFTESFSTRINKKDGTTLGKSEIYSTDGKLIESYINSSEIIINHNKLASGIYIVQIQNENQKPVSVKVVVP